MSRFCDYKIQEPPDARVCMLTCAILLSTLPARKRCDAVCTHACDLHCHTVEMTSGSEPASDVRQHRHKPPCSARKTRPLLTHGFRHVTILTATRAEADLGCKQSLAAQVAAYGKHGEEPRQSRGGQDGKDGHTLHISSRAAATSKQCPALQSAQSRFLLREFLLHTQAAGGAPA